MNRSGLSLRMGSTASAAESVKPPALVAAVNGSAVVVARVVEEGPSPPAPMVAKVCGGERGDREKEAGSACELLNKTMGAA